MSEFDLPPEQAPPGPLLRVLRDQRVAFLIVGGINTVVGFGFFVLADLTVGRWVDTAAGAVAGSLVTLGIAHVLGVLFAFVMHRRFVFRVRGHLLQDLVRFESVYLVSLAINAITLPLLVAVGVPRLLAQASITAATTILSYVGHRYFSFRRPSGDQRRTYTEQPPQSASTPGLNEKESASTSAEDGYTATSDDSGPTAK